jgi:hypothetical protein
VAVQCRGVGAHELDVPGPGEYRPASSNRMLDPPAPVRLMAATCPPGGPRTRRGRGKPGRAPRRTGRPAPRAGSGVPARPARLELTERPPERAPPSLPLTRSSDRRGVPGARRRQPGVHLRSPGPGRPTHTPFRRWPPMAPTRTSSCCRSSGRGGCRWSISPGAGIAWVATPTRAEREKHAPARGRCRPRPLSPPSTDPTLGEITPPS